MTENDIQAGLTTKEIKYCFKPHRVSIDNKIFIENKFCTSAMYSISVSKIPWYNDMQLCAYVVVKNNNKKITE